MKRSHRPGLGPRTSARNSLEHGVNIVYRWVGVFVAVSLLCLLLVVWWKNRGESHVPLPDFAAVTQVSERKALFFGFLTPFIEEANQAILREREKLLSLGDTSDWSKRDQRWVRKIAAYYGLEFGEDEELPADLKDKLLLRVDVIPASLALSQAALESAWGTSRFAQQGNNLFGIWCYEPGCGIVPKRRPAGKTYEVKKYPSPVSSFQDYMENLNSNTAYRDLWRIRARLRSAGKPITGVALAGGLRRYSQEGPVYVEKIRGMIRSNSLDRG